LVGAADACALEGLDVSQAGEPDEPRCLHGVGMHANGGVLAAPPLSRQMLMRAIDLNCVIALDSDTRDAYLCVPLEPPVKVTEAVAELEADGMCELRHSGTPLVTDEWVLTDTGRAELSSPLEPVERPGPGWVADVDGPMWWIGVSG
jgi:hypothetical protein